MELDNNDAAVCIEATDAQATDGAEIDLYAELTAFAELSPDEQMRSAFSPAIEIAEEIKISPISDDAQVQPPIQPVEKSPIEPALAVFESKESGLSLQLSLVRPEVFQLPRPVEPPAVESITAPAEFGPESEASKEYVEPAEVRPSPAVEGPRPSGPLSGFNLPPDIVYTGALSKGTCLACGAESSADDLFCIACGVFIDEIASTLPFIPTCMECNRGISADEIFCPWCGSALPA